MAEDFKPHPLKEALLDARAQAAYYQALVQSFFNGEQSPLANDLTGAIMAQWGQRRLEERKRQARLLTGD
jgi:hypothetical protein